MVQTTLYTTDYTQKTLLLDLLGTFLTDPHKSIFRPFDYFRIARNPPRTRNLESLASELFGECIGDDAPN
jgi:hypothetical protein